LRLATPGDKRWINTPDSPWPHMQTSPVITEWYNQQHHAHRGRAVATDHAPQIDRYCAVLPTVSRAATRRQNGGSGAVATTSYRH
jgi:hypothetical protein